MFEKPGEIMLLLRFTEYENHDFIIEHEKILKANGCVWILKIGKEIPEKKLTEVKDSGGWLILKGPKAKGGKMYTVHFTTSYTGAPKAEMCYPEYYSKFINDENLDYSTGLTGTWFCVDYIQEETEYLSEHLHLISNGKLAAEVLRCSRSSILYVYSDNGICTTIGKRG